MNTTLPAESPIVVAALCGSLRPGGSTRRALVIALEGAAEAGAETRLIDLRDYRLAFCGADDGGDADDVSRFRRDVRQAQGLILGTPEYHGSFSGVLKNALDLMSPADVSGKMIGLVGVSGGPLGASNALNALRTVARALHAWVVPEQASVPSAHNAFNRSERLHDPALEARLKDVGRAVARFAALHASATLRDMAPSR